MSDVKRKSKVPRKAYERELHRLQEELVKLKRGMKPEDARKIVALVKETGLKVQAAIQGEAVRITGKKKDDLQACMQKIRGAALGFPIMFQNFRD